MSQGRDELWSTAAAACARLAAGLAPGGQPDFEDSETLHGALNALAGQPDNAPTADFLRDAAAAAAAIASLAATRPISVPTSVRGLDEELNRWCTAGYAAVSLCAAVQHGCLEGLETRQAFGLASASLVLTDGVPTALSQLVVPTLRHASLYDDTVGLAGQTCNAIVTMLRMISRQLSSPSVNNQPAAVVGAQPQAAAARLLRSTAARPALILAALENLTDTLLYTKPHEQDSDECYKAVRNWLDLAALVLTDKLCAAEAQRLRQQPNLHARISTLASGMAYRLLLPEAWDSSPDRVCSWQAALVDATTVITSGVLLPTATGGLTELVLGAESHGNSQLRGLVPTALSSLEAALADAAAGGPSATTSAVRALQLAAFVADAMLAVGCDAGLAPAPGTIGATRAALQAPRQDTGEAEPEQLQLRLLLQSHAQVPALLAAVDAALQRGVLDAAGGAYSEARCQLALLRIGCFVSWLGIAGIQAPDSLLSLQPGAVASCAAAAWLPVLHHSLQLHATYSGSEAADGFASNLGTFMERLAQGSRGLAATHSRAALLMPGGRGELRQERLAAGAGAAAEVAAQEPDAALQPGAELHTFHQLATATCILAQLAASAREVQGERCWRQLLCWGNGELREAGVVEQLDSVSQGFHRLLNASKLLPSSGDGSSSSAGVLAADGQLGSSLLQIIAAGSTLLDALAPRQPGVAFASAAGRSCGPLIGQAVKSLATIAQQVMIMAHDVGQAAAAAEAERLVGRALKLAADWGCDARLLGDAWMGLTCMLRPWGRAGMELVASGAVDSAIAWLQDWSQSATEEWQQVLMLAVHSGIAASLLCAAQQLVPPLPQAEPGSPPSSDAQLLAAAEQQVRQHLGLSGKAAQAAAVQLVRRAAADGAQADRHLRQLADLIGALSIDFQEVPELINSVLPRLDDVAAEQTKAGSAAANELALARCAALRRRRCAHLGCTNVPLLLGADVGQRPQSYKCTGCRAARFCSEACSRADWRVHRQACRQLAAARAAAAAGGEQQT